MVVEQTTGAANRIAFRALRGGSPGAMATCKVHDEAAKHARKLIDAGTYDDTTDWSEAAPSPDDATTEINEETFGDSPGGIWASTPTRRKARKGASRSPTATSRRSTERR